MKSWFRSIFDFFWAKEFVRFLVAGAINTAIGYLVTIFFARVVGLPDPVPTILNYIFCFPIAYTIHARLAFRTPISKARMLAYLFTSLPSYFLGVGFTLLFVNYLHIPGEIGYLMAYVCPVPIMFFIIRFIVKPGKTTKK